MLGGGLSAHYLFAFTNEHGIFLTRLLTWAIYRLADGNPIIQTACNYGIFLGACWLLRRLLKQLDAPGTDILLCSAALPIACDVHNWGFQTHFYGTFALFLAALCMLSRRDAWVYLAGPLAILGCMSFSAGLAFAVALAVVAGCLAWLAPERRWAHLWVVGACIGGMAWWAYLWPGHLPGHPPAAMPWGKPFWNFMAVHLGASIGWTGPTARTVGYVVMLGGSLSLVAYTVRAWRQRSAPMLTVAGAALGILGALALTAVGRAGTSTGVEIHARYTTYSLFFAMILWAMNAVLFRKADGYLAALAAVFLAQMAPHFQYKRPYRMAYEENVRAQACAAEYYLDGNSGLCDAILPWSAAPWLDAIWQADTFAIKEIKQGHAGAHWRYGERPGSPSPES